MRDIDQKENGVCFFVGNLSWICGATSQTLLIVRELAASKIPVFIFTYPPSEPGPPCQFSPRKKHIFPDGVEIVEIEETQKSFSDALRHLKHRFSTAVFGNVPHPYQLRFLKSLGKKVVMRMTGYRLNDLTTIKNNPLYKDVFPYLPLVDRFIGISPPLSRSVADSGFDRELLAEIPNMVDTDDYFPADPVEKESLRSALNLPAGALLVTYVGSIKQSKGIDIIFEAWEAIKAANDKAYLLLIGPMCSTCGCCGRWDWERDVVVAQVRKTLDMLTGKLSSLIQKHEKMIFLGAKENVRDYLRASDIFLFPSRQEGMPNAVMEAMACRLACVTSGIEEITADLIPDDRFGLAVGGEDPADYAQAVLKLAADEELREKIGGQARRRMVDKFSPPLIRARYHALICELLKQDDYSPIANRP